MPDKTVSIMVKTWKKLALTVLRLRYGRHFPASSQQCQISRLSGSVAERSKVSNSGPMVVSSNPALGHQC